MSRKRKAKKREGEKEKKKNHLFENYRLNYVARDL